MKERIMNVRKIRKVLADSVISFYDSDGTMQTFRTHGNVRNVAGAVKVLMKAGIVNVLIDDIKVNKHVYLMDVETFIKNAECVPSDSADSGNDNVDDDAIDDGEF